MRTITHKDFVRLTGGSAYYGGRWQYMSKVTAVIDELSGVYTGVELGCHAFSVMTKGVTIDINPLVDPDVILNAAVTPWPFRDGNFDIIVALQVLEHIPERTKVFNEMKRVAECAVVTLPYNWDCPADVMHHGIDDKVLDGWFGKEECVRQVIENPVYRPKPRVMLCFDFTEGKIYDEQFRKAVRKVFSS